MRQRRTGWGDRTLSSCPRQPRVQRTRLPVRSTRSSEDRAGAPSSEPPRSTGHDRTVRPHRCRGSPDARRTASPSPRRRSRTRWPGHPDEQAARRVRAAAHAGRIDRVAGRPHLHPAQIAAIDENQSSPKRCRRADQGADANRRQVDRKPRSGEKPSGLRAPRRRWELPITCEVFSNRGEQGIDAVVTSGWRLVIDRAEEFSVAHGGHLVHETKDGPVRIALVLVASPVSNARQRGCGQPSHEQDPTVARVPADMT